MRLRIAIIDILRHHRSQDYNVDFWDTVQVLDLQGANLAGVDLSGIDLRLGNFTECQFPMCEMRNSNFAGADMSYAILRDAKLNESDLSGTNLYIGGNE